MSTVSRKVPLKFHFIGDHTFKHGGLLDDIGARSSISPKLHGFKTTGILSALMFFFNEAKLNTI